MALRSALDLHCPVCLEVFRDPVLLSCSHSFCMPCLQSWWAEKVTRDCPLCKRRSSREEPPRNLVLKNLCESFSQELSLEKDSAQTDDVCPQHREKLRLFCIEHQQLICLICRDSRVHLNHSFRPVDEAAQENKLWLKKNLTVLEERLHKLNWIKFEWQLTSEHIDEQGRQTEHQIRAEFEKIRAFLQKEEEVRIRALRSEVEEKRSLMEQRVVDLRREMQALSETIRQIEEQLKSQDVQFLKNYKASGQCIEETLPKVLPSVSLVDVAKHLGNLRFIVWSKMKELVTYTPVILDPNTACSFITVSTDLCSVQYETAVNKSLPDNSERFKYFVTVMGSEGYVSRKHRWDVEVTDDADWAVGVLAQSMPRKQKAIVPGTWTIWRRNGKYVAHASPFVDQPLPMRHRPQRIRVDLDCDAGTLKLSDPITNTHYYTFTDLPSERLYPCIDTLSPTPVRILPLEISVQKCT